MLENIKLSFEEVSGDATTTTTIVINKKVRTLDEALDAIRNHYNGPLSEPAKPAEAPVPPAPPAPPTGWAPATPPAPPVPPVPPAGRPTPPPAPPAPGAGAPPAPPVPPAPPAPGAPGGGIDRQGLIDKINAKFETDPKYRDFMQIINVMKQATAPNEKTAINDFTDEEVQKLANLVL